MATLHLFILVVFGAYWDGAAAGRIDAPCSACRAVALELQSRIENEPTRNHLDMRHRLDSQGQRYGKVIDYKVSELRAIELLDGLCTRMNQWTLVTINGTAGSTWHWEPTDKAAPGSRPQAQEEEVRQKQLTTYCGRVLEEYDEEITHAIQAGKLENGGATAWLCDGLLGTCPPGARAKSDTLETVDGTTSAAAAAAITEAVANQPTSSSEPAPSPNPEL